MSKFDLGGHRALALLGALVLSAGVAACGDDDDEASEPRAVAIEASGGKNDLELTVPAEAEAGPAEITLTNDTNEDQDGQMAFVAEGEEREDHEVVGQLQNAISGKPVEDWFQAVGGPGVARPGDSSSATIDLEAGTYYVFPQSQDQVDSQDLTKFTVTGSSDEELPEADGTVSAVEYSFSAEGLKAGERTLLLDNEGGTWHHFLATKLKDDATIEQAKEFLMSEGEGGGESPFGSEQNAVESTVMDGGRSELVTANLEPGRYAFFCFISDKQTGGPPHVAKGMVSEVEVTE